MRGMLAGAQFCVADEVDQCAGKRDVYVSLVLEMPEFKETRLMRAVGERVAVTLPGGERYEQRATAGDPMPIDFRVFRAPHKAIPEGVVRSSFEVAVPRTDAPGAALVVKGDVN